ncbi:type I-E CRISPR-associated protein Cas7/Cse4/CasC [Dolosigranulum pigrum]|nr:type I-E CRISPR-associated protein Cas7/Cse4/CasC [Dolosigranulum pigrum]QTJ46402.1 type I-E CRISPR-associated protein Cas7/Cse4/CasC [Dolosigranulum pigrum]QTJ51520.1 type I-E CRISPR-associated protein Cas7/Cse4/CasC [Dolosigranulum pigrum]
MMERLFLDVHAIQTLPPSNVNRDDTGSPKTAQYGGVTRGRVSSQSWKKAIRDYFKEFGSEEVGTRTLRVPKYISQKIKEIDPSKTDDEAMELAIGIVDKIGLKTVLRSKSDKTDKEKQLKALYFIGSQQANSLAQAALDGVTDKKELKKISDSYPDIDIALFGRMVADDPTLNEDASCQVAHAISTHAVEKEFDFYTAIDEMQDLNNAGAGMLGTLEFNSSTYYRYANIAVHELIEQLKDKDTTINALKLFVEAFTNSMPSGKSNSYANLTLPQALMVNLRIDRPVNLVTAFEKPVRASEDGFVDESIKKIKNELDKVEQFVKEPKTTLSVGVNIGEDCNNLSNLLDKLEEEIKLQLEN